MAPKFERQGRILGLIDDDTHAAAEPLDDAVMRDGLADHRSRNAMASEAFEGGALAQGHLVNGACH